MSIVKFYRGDPNAPKTTMPAHLGANVILTCKGRLLLERRRDSDTWGLIGGGVKKTETELQAIAREIYEELGLRIPKERFTKLSVYGEPGRIAAYREAASGGWSLWYSALTCRKSRNCVSARNHGNCGFLPRMN